MENISNYEKIQHNTFGTIRDVIVEQIASQALMKKTVKLVSFGKILLHKFEMKSLE